MSKSKWVKTVIDDNTIKTNLVFHLLWSLYQSTSASRQSRAQFNTAICPIETQLVRSHKAWIKPESMLCSVWRYMKKVNVLVMVQACYSLSRPACSLCLNSLIVCQPIVSEHPNTPHGPLQAERLKKWS